MPVVEPASGPRCGGTLAGNTNTAASMVEKEAAKMQLRFRVLLWATLALVVATPPVVAQSEFVASYAMPHLFALATATTTRLFGMGGFVTCVPDVGFGNPAFAATLQTAHAGVRHSETDFDSGLGVSGTQVWYNRPVRPDYSGWQVTFFDLSSDPGLVNAGGPTLRATVAERDLALHYGQRVGRQWCWGIGLSPVLDTKTDYSDPITHTPLERIESDVDKGARVGGLYQMGDLGWVGFVYDRYDEDVKWSGVILSAGSATFTSEEIAVGLSRQVADNVLAAVEWQQLSTEGLGVRLSDSGFRLGAEVTLSPAWQARGGWNDGGLSLGAGWNHGAWSAQYAFVSNWNDDSVRAALGGSDTHQLEIRRSW